MKLKIVISLVAVLWTSGAIAQTSPNFTYGEIPTVGMWNALFAGKQDTLGFVPLNSSGGVMSGPLITAASLTSAAGFNIPPGTAPTSPNNGDLWTTTAGLYAQINGSTVGPFVSSATCSICAFTNASNLFTVAIQTDEGATTTTPGWYAQLTGDTVARARFGLSNTDVASLAFGSGSASRDTFLERAGAANFRLGTADAASPVAQTLSVQNVVAGTSNTAGASLTIQGSLGTGNAIGGGIFFKIAPAGVSGTAQNSATTALSIFGDGGLSTGAAIDEGAGTLNLAGALYNNGTAPTGTGAYVRASSPSLVTPTIGAAIGTSLLLGTGSLSDTLTINGTNAAYSSSLRIYDTTDAAGIQIQAYFPSVNLNSYYDGTNLRYMGTGYAAQYQLNPSTGTFEITQTAASGTAGNVATLTPTFTIDKNGNATFPAAATLTLGTAGSNVGKLAFANATSGTIAIDAPTGALGTVTNVLQAANDTFVYRATTDTLTNKTIASSTDVLGGVTMTLGSDATGDLYYRNSSGILTRLGIGSSGQVLQVNTGLPSWQAGSSAGSITAGSTTIGGTCPSTELLYSSSGVLTCSAINGFLVAGNGISITGTTTPTIAVSLSALTNSLGSNVTMTSASTYYDGPSVAQGTTGTWWANGNVVVSTAGSGDFYCKLWDGTTVIDSAAVGISNTFTTVSLSGYLATPAANIKISCENTSTGGSMVFNQSGAAKDSTISVHRIQ